MRFVCFLRVTAGEAAQKTGSTCKLIHLHKEEVDVVEVEGRLVHSICFIEVRSVRKRISSYGVYVSVLYKFH